MANTRGRKPADGAKIVARQVITLSLDQTAKDVLDTFMAQTGDNIGGAIRAALHYIHETETTGGHTKNTTTRAAAEPAEIVGGHAKTNTQVSGAGGADKLAAARQAAIDAREKKDGGLLSEVSRHGGKKAHWKIEEDKEAYARGERTAW